MATRPEHRVPTRTARLVPAFALILGALALLGIASAVSLSPVTGVSDHGTIVALPSDQNGSSNGDPPGSADALCPSGGPTILWVEWNCVAELNLTELALFLTSIGIVAYVFKDADRAELPGESEEVPITAEELEAYRRARKLGIPYEPPEPHTGDERR